MILCTFVYSVLSKIVVNRLKKILSKLISEEQCSFVKGRVITDICLSQELMGKLGKKVRVSNIAVKLVMFKAYERWIRISFSLSDGSIWFLWQWIFFISNCITSLWSYAIYQGVSIFFFESSRSLRQEALHCSIYLYGRKFWALCWKSNLREEKLVLVLSRDVAIIFMIFSMLKFFNFLQGTKKSRQGIISTLSDYGNVSGQQITKNKSWTIPAKSFPRFAVKLFSITYLQGVLSWG